MGRCKQLLPLPDRPAVVRCVETLLAAGVDDVVVVIGPEGAPVADAVACLPVSIARNPEPVSDMAGSVRAGLAAADPAAAALFVCLCDHPLVTPATLAAMHRHWLVRPESIVIPRCGGRNGHPTLLPRRILAKIDRLPTLRDVIAGHRDRVSFLDLDDPGTVMDMDTWEDYQALLARCLPAD